MKFQIIHQNIGRIRIHLVGPKLTSKQADALEQHLIGMPDIKSAVVHERTNGVIVSYTCTRDALIQRLLAIEYDNLALTDEAQNQSRELNQYYKSKLVMKVVNRYFNNLFMPRWYRTIRCVVRSVPYIWRGFVCLIHGKLRVELLDALSIGISIARGDFNTASSVRFLLELGELLEEWTHKKSVSDLARSMSLNIDKVWLLTQDSEIQVPITQICAGDLISVRMGNVIPLDGVIESGEVMVNQSSLTGESVPVAKRPGTSIYAGTVVEEGECVIRVEQRLGDSRYDQIVQMIETSERMKSSVENRASYLADKLVPYTLLGSAATYLFTRNVTRALSALMVDFSCALKLAMPLSVLSAMREAGTYHAVVKGGRFLEQIANADTIVFDKTGTLTHACPTVAQIVPFDGNDENEMLRIAACLEEHFPHSMANAVVQEAKKRGLQHEEMHTEVDYIVAHGIESTVDGNRVLIGSYHFVFQDETCVIPRGEKKKFHALPAAYSHLYMSISGRLAAVICIYDPLRDEAADVIRELHKLGITHTVMLTGDSERTAAAIAVEVGVDEYHAEVLPEDKAHFVEQARAEGHTVIMIGDGINDSPALSAANVGIAISDGAAIAREISDVMISAEDLNELLALRRLATALMARIHANYRFVIGFNGSLILLGALGILPPATSATLHNASTLGISLRSMTNLL